MKNLPESNDPTRELTKSCTLSVKHGFYYNPEYFARLSQKAAHLLIMHERSHLSFIAIRMTPEVYRSTVETLDHLEREVMSVDFPNSGRS